MGNNFAMIYACFFLCDLQDHVEDCTFPQFDNHMLYFRQYIDDAFGTGPTLNTNFKISWGITRSGAPRSTSLIASVTRWLICLMFIYIRVKILVRHIISLGNAIRNPKTNTSICLGLLSTHCIKRRPLLLKNSNVMYFGRIQDKASTTFITFFYEHLHAWGYSDAFICKHF